MLFDWPWSLEIPPLSSSALVGTKAFALHTVPEGKATPPFCTCCCYQLALTCSQLERQSRELPKGLEWEGGLLAALLAKVLLLWPYSEVHIQLVSSLFLCFA